MQQIENLNQHKKTSDLERPLICDNGMVRQVDNRWNRLYPGLLLLHEKLVKLDLLLVLEQHNGP